MRVARRVEGKRRPAGHAAAARLRPEGGVAGHLQAHEVRHRATRHHLAAGALRQAEARGEPADERGLHLVGAGAQPEPAEVLVERGRDEVGHGAGDRAGPRHVRSKAGVAREHRGVEHERAQVGDQLRVRHSLVGHLEPQKPSDVFGAQPAAHRKIGQALQQLRPEVHHGAAQLRARDAGQSRSGTGGGGSAMPSTLPGHRQAGISSAERRSLSSSTEPSGGSASGGSSPPRSVPAISSSGAFSLGMKPDFIPK